MQHYELLQQIGKGSYGKVFTARNYQDHVLYVLKRVPFDGASSAEADAALREANLLSLLRHPHIVPYKEFFNHDGDLCLVMAHCEGGDLYRYIKQIRKSGQIIEEEKVWKWLVQLLLALSYCHSKKILHRDVKTQNIFMTKDGRLMLGDFGLAKQLQRTLEMARTPIGTPYYMAPEIYEESPYSYKSDVWALGCVFYEVMTGKPAFAADNLSRVVIRVLKGSFDPLPEHYSQTLRELISCMLTKEVQKRPNANELLQHPCVVSKVQAYLDELSRASGPGWNTWRMKLPAGIMVQMANIIATKSNGRISLSGVRVSSNGRESENGSNALSDNQNKGTQGEVASPGLQAGGGILGHLEELLTSDELIQEFGLQSLLDEACKMGGRNEEQNHQAKLLAATMHPDDNKRLQLPEAQGGAEFRVLQTQMTVVANGGVSHEADNCGNIFQNEEERPAAQLLGMTNRTNRANRDISSSVDAQLSPDLALLSMGLPKAGFGFETPIFDLPKAGFGFGMPTPAPVTDVAKSADSALPVEPPALPSTPVKVILPHTNSKKGLAPLPGGAYSSFKFKEQSQGQNSPGSPSWKLPVGSPQPPPLGQQPSIENGQMGATVSLKQELAKQIGQGALDAACAVIKELQDSKDGDPAGDAELRHALEGVVSPAHLELAPLLDELVLLQERCYAD